MIQNLKIEDVTEEDRINYLEMKELIELDYLNNNYILSKKFDELIIDSLICGSSQKYSIWVQNWYISKVLGIKLTANSDKYHGDFKDQYGRYCEFKSSFVTNLKSVVKIRALKPVSKTKEYHVLVVDVRNKKNITPYHFILNKHEMLMELEMLSNPYLKGNEELLGIDMDINSDSFKRWQNEYKTSLKF